MRYFWIIAVGLAVAGVSCAVFLLRPGGGERDALEETRRALRQQGFKIDLDEFNFSTSAELRDQAAALTFLGHLVHSQRLSESLDLMDVIGTNAACAWSQGKLQTMPQKQKLRESVCVSQVARNQKTAVHINAHSAQNASSSRSKRTTFGRTRSPEMRLARASTSGHFTRLLFPLGFCGTFSSNCRTATRNFSRSRSGNALTFLSNSTALTTIR